MFKVGDSLNKQKTDSFNKFYGKNLIFVLKRFFWEV